MSCLCLVVLIAFGSGCKVSVDEMFVKCCVCWGAVRFGVQGLEEGQGPL